MAIPENPFQEAEDVLVDIDDRLTALETGANQAIIDRLNAIEAENAALKTRVEALEATAANHRERFITAGVALQG